MGFSGHIDLDRAVFENLTSNTPITYFDADYLRQLVRFMRQANID